MPLDSAGYTVSVPGESQLLKDLRAVQAYLSDAGNWWQNSGANEGRGEHCLVTAVNPVIGWGDLSRCLAVWDAIYRAIGGQGETHHGPIWRFNDSHTHAEILNLLDRAIQQEHLLASA